MSCWHSKTNEGAVWHVILHVPGLFIMSSHHRFLMLWISFLPHEDHVHILFLLRWQVCIAKGSGSVHETELCLCSVEGEWNLVTPFHRLDTKTKMCEFLLSI